MKVTGHARLGLAVAGLLILSSCVLVAVNHAVKAANPHDVVPFQKGMSFTTWRDGAFNSTGARQELQAMRDAGVEWVNINAWWWQDYLNSTEIKPGPWSDSHENLTACFDFARSIGLRVLYKPMLNLLQVYDWRSYIHFTPAWMDAYTAWMVDNAKIAEAGGVEILSIGCEMGNMQVHSAEVRAMIAQVRSEFSGLLTYSANHDSYMHVDWWDAVDFIGISMYTPLTLAWDPTVDELRTAWDGMHDGLEALSVRWNRPVAFTEIGIQARDGSSMIPNDNQVSTLQDTAEMRNYYVSLFTSRLWRAPWFKGVHWWIWDLTPYSPDLDGFNPVLVADTIAEHYAVDRAMEPVAAKLIVSLLPLVAGGIVLVMVVVKRPSPLAGRGAPASPEGATRGAGRGYTFGLLLGVASVHAMTSLTTSLFAAVHESVSTAIILQTTPGMVVSMYLVMLVVAVIAGISFARFAPRHVLLAAFLLALAGPYLVMAGAVHATLVKALVDMLLATLLAGAIVVHVLAFSTGDVARVVVSWVAVAVVLMAVALVLGELVQSLLAVPLGTVILRVAGKEPVTTRVEPDDPATRPVPRWRTAGIEHLAIGTAFLAGVLLPSGNSAVNLMHMTVLGIAMHYLPSLLAATGIVVVIVVLGRVNVTRTTVDVTSWMTSNHVLVAMLLLALAGFPFLLAGRPVVAWALPSGFVLVLFAGSLAARAARVATQRQVGRACLHYLVVSCFLALGFIMNAFKALLVYVFTFLVFKDGSLVRRDPSVDPVPNFDVPFTIHSVVLLLVIVVAVTLLVYRLVAFKAWKRTFFRVPAPPSS